mgnify:CR=1 FL=1
METNLIILLLGFCLVFGIYIFINIFKRKISLQHSLMWFIYVILMVLCLAFPGITEVITKLLGFELASNMIFFFGFAILIVICFNMTKIISKEKEKVVILTQEIAILKHELSKKEK